MEKGEIVSAFKNINKYNGFKAKTLRWFDTGNLDDLNLTKKYFNDSPISLEKNTGQISYVGKDFIKFNPNPKTIKNISKRAKKLENLIQRTSHPQIILLSINGWRNDTFTN